MTWGTGVHVRIAVAAICVVLLQSATAASVRKQPWNLEETIPAEYSSQSIDTEWASGPVLLLEQKGQLIAANVETDKIEVLVPKEVYEKAGVVKAKMSVDKKYVLLAYDAQREFRHAASARYMAHRIKDNETLQIAGGERLQLAKWGTQGSQLAYVYENNIYYLPSPDAEPMQITSDGVPDVVFNGIRTSFADASSHPMETVGKDGMLWFSPNGMKLLFAQNDVTNVANASFIRYGRPGIMEYQYADLVTFRYPKAGTPMAAVALKLAALPSEDSASLSIQQLVAPIDVVGEDHYLDSMAWVNDTTVMAWWMNRAANVRQDMIYVVSSKLKDFVSNDLKTSVSSDVQTKIYGEKGLKIEQKNGWLDSHPAVFQDGKESTTYLTILWQPYDENVSFPQVVKVTGNSTEAITSGYHTVTKIYGWAPRGAVYYQAADASEPGGRQVFDWEKGGSFPTNINWEAISPEGNICARGDAFFSDDYKWYIVKCYGPDPPFSALLIAEDDEARQRLYYGNKELRKLLEVRQQPQPLDELFEMDEGMNAHMRLLLPPDLDPEGSEKRPAIVHVNAYPGTQSIDDSFTVDISNYFTTNRRYVYIYIDGRGSGCKGDRMIFSVYRRLGTIDVEDQINLTKWLTKKYPFIDSSRVAIWGKGYGGYVTAMALAKDECDVFKCGVSVAPITSWIYTDIQQSERYMGFPTPEDNEEGYNASDVTRLAERFARKKFLLMHGTADDTVLYQNSMALATALEDANVLFEQQSYPDENHSIESLNLHLYRTIDEFFLRCFDRTDLLVDIINDIIS